MILYFILERETVAGASHVDSASSFGFGQQYWYSVFRLCAVRKIDLDNKLHLRLYVFGIKKLAD